jgi:cation:H+ antiporter
MNRVTRNYVILTAASIIGVVVVLLLEGSANAYSSLTLVLAVVTFASVIAAAMMIAWAAEASQFSISQGLALAIVAIVQTLPEFFVEGAIAWNAGQGSPEWLANVTANFTGANRLLTGFGWPLILFTVLVQRRRNGTNHRPVISLNKEHSIEVVFMLGATLYFIPIWLRGSLELIDTIVLGGAFAAYLYVLSRLPKEDENPEEVLDASPLVIVKMPKKSRAAAIVGLFLVSGFVFVVISHPFVESVNTIAVALFGAGAGFFFIQLIAPFLSEFPEKVTAFHWARKIKLAPMALLNFVSSSVSELTALVAIIPVVFAISFGGISSVSVQAHRDEVLLTLAQSLYACACLMDLEYDTRNALVLLGLWLVSTAFVPSRFWISIVFLVLTPVELLIQRGRLTAFSAFRDSFRNPRGNSQHSDR